MKHEDDMTPGEYRRYVKHEFRNGPHEHLCDYCERPWECQQITHCRREERATCPDCYIEVQAKRDAKRAKELNQPIADLLKKVFP